ncbi:Threonine/homoserine/homoserine lactone efflux protein [Paraburkholderia fungorum]|uniref:Threonine/homoserine/homoserine lactone efflux protein n=1 Tax=Paraburkholderia fungorum TaxID=134537 RepID=A0A1H1JXR4_9BURK|nr:LysE family translocator [Paraburkholderia fungorum]SDR54716.1 Threonine/homoserine/homoserine lactone efflux protein [Paraburkholderia fungorum]
MTTHAMLAVLVSAFLICSTPGPNMLHVLTRCVQFGFRRSLPAMGGCLLGLVLVLALSAAGLGALMRASGLCFHVVQYAGVAYLVYLGIRQWLATDEISPAAKSTKAESSLQMFGKACSIGLTNPKLLIFGTAFMPQFVDSLSNPYPQYAIVIACFVACETFWYCVYGTGSRHVRRLLARPALRKAFNRLAGTLFIAFGGLLLLDKC